MNPIRRWRALFLSTVVAAAVLSGAGSALLGICGPFSDVSDVAFCPFVLEVFYMGITTGTTPSTYDPASAVTRLQMAAFLSRSVDRVLKRGSRRAALDQFWTQGDVVLGLTTVGTGPQLLKSDGSDVWVTDGGSTVSRVRGSDGKLLETWTGASGARGVLPAVGRILLAGQQIPGRLYMIDPTKTAGAVTTVASNLGGNPFGIAYDGTRVWTANANSSVSIVTPGTAVPWTVTTVTVGFSGPAGAVCDGANIWITDFSAGTLLKLDPGAAILQTVTVGVQPGSLVFDGTNLWVPNKTSNSVSVVRASSGVILQTLTGNGLDGPFAAAFDGERVLVTNNTGHSVSLWKSADLTVLGTFSTGGATSPIGAASDGVNFWIALNGVSKIARF